ncbi:MAG: alpha/beta hydrolase [Pyrinomonadaceae bacterium]
MKKLALLLLTITLAYTGFAQSPPINLWENGAPNAVGKEPPDIPTITPFLAPKETATGAAVLVLPGGGYARLSDVKEGSDVAKWLNSLGISAFVLKYRLGPRYNQPTPLLDAARAMRTIRSRSKEWAIDPNRIAILGFSAGGHLASTLGTRFDAGKPDAKDEIEKVSSRPDLLILLYPVITMGEYTHAGSKRNLLGENPTPELIKLYSSDLHVTKETPPTFLMHTMTDAGVPVENSMQFAAALRKHGVPFEFHLYEQGPHGVGLALTNPYLASWAGRCADWLALRGFLKAK